MSEETKMVKVTPLGQTELAKQVSERFKIPQEQLLRLIKTKLIKVPPTGEHSGAVTEAELALVLNIIGQYELNPVLGQVHAWRDNRGQMNTMIGYDGWVDYANRQPTFLRVTYEYGDTVPSPDKKGKNCWEWIKATVHDSVRGEIPQVPIYLEEWYVPKRGTNTYDPPWQAQTRHKLHVVAFRSAIREVYGFGAGTVIDEDASIYRMPSQGQLTDQKTEEMIKYRRYQALPMSTEALGEPDDAKLEDDMVAAMAGEPSDENEDDEEYVTPEEAKNIIPPGKHSPPRHEAEPEAEVKDECAVPGCGRVTERRCGSCGEWFCGEHMAEDLDRCQVCFTGGA